MNAFYHTKWFGLACWAVVILGLAGYLVWDNLRRR